ncbi:hypothetical protein B0H15DRAFT_932785 [Mycena belliarum]|uniref:Uncharacterized protein n=1 Tax=Mycena belliarum TaxID=1033014 RepID=A0AAD6U1Z9_9AGAR|nr:hypothetical protein B0H15DRAFT_932785 [Mycena belliae]
MRPRRRLWVSALCRPLPTHPCAVSPLRSSEADTYKRPRSPRARRGPRCEARGLLAPSHRTSRSVSFSLATSTACAYYDPAERSSARRLRTRTPSFATPPLPRCSTRRSRTPLQAQHPLAFCGTNASGHIICFPAIGVGSRRRARRPSPPSNPLPPRPCVPCPQPPARPAARTVSPANSRPKCARGSRIAAPSSLVRRLLLPPAIARDRLHRRRARPSVPVPEPHRRCRSRPWGRRARLGRSLRKPRRGTSPPRARDLRGSRTLISQRRMSSWAGKQEVANEAPAHDVGYVEAARCCDLLRQGPLAQRCARALQPRRMSLASPVPAPGPLALSNPVGRPVRPWAVTLSLSLLAFCSLKPRRRSGRRSLVSTPCAHHARRPPPISRISRARDEDKLAEPPPSHLVCAAIETPSSDLRGDNAADQVCASVPPPSHSPRETTHIPWLEICLQASRTSISGTDPLLRKVPLSFLRHKSKCESLWCILPLLYLTLSVFRVSLFPPLPSQRREHASPPEYRSAVGRRKAASLLRPSNGYFSRLGFDAASVSRSSLAARAAPKTSASTAPARGDALYARRRSARFLPPCLARRKSSDARTVCPDVVLIPPAFKNVLSSPSRTRTLAHHAEDRADTSHTRGTRSTLSPPR